MRIAVADNAHEVYRVNSLAIGNNTAQQLLQNAHFVCREGGQDLLLLFGSNISQHAGLAFSCLGQVMAILGAGHQTFTVQRFLRLFDFSGWHRHFCQ